MVGSSRSSGTAAPVGGETLPGIAWFKQTGANAAEELVFREARAVLTGAELDSLRGAGGGGGPISRRTAEDSASANTRSIEAVGQLLGRFQGVRKELRKLSKAVDRKLEALKVRGG
jgi:hypothetical protein